MVAQLAMGRRRTLAATGASVASPGPVRRQEERVLEASMLVIGDEILGGFVQDTNSGWLASQLVEAGVPLTRVHTVPDDFAAIDEALQAELGRSRPRVVVTSGGVGSTPDDITFEAVASSLGLELEEHPDLAPLIDRAIDWAAGLGLDVEEGNYAEHMRRMCRVPVGARLVGAEYGWVPGVAVDVDGGSDAEGGATVVILPGVPSQFRGIVKGAIRPELLEGRNPPIEVVEVEHGFPESALNPCFEVVLAEFPDVKLGSYPGDTMLVRLLGPVGRAEAAAKVVREHLEALLATEGGARMAAQWTHRWRNQDENS